MIEGKQRPNKIQRERQPKLREAASARWRRFNSNNVCADGKAASRTDGKSPGDNERIQRTLNEDGGESNDPDEGSNDVQQNSLR